MKEIIQKRHVFLWKRPEDNAVLTTMNQSISAELGLLTGKDALLLHDADLVDSELVFGDPVEVLTEKDGWKKIAAIGQGKVGEEKGYEGWIEAEDSIPLTYQVDEVEKVAITSQYAPLKFCDGLTSEVEYPFGCVFPIIEEWPTNYLVHTPLGQATIDRYYCQKTNAFTGEDLANNLVHLAKQFRGLSYVWGGISGSGFDCSGFAYSLHRAHGILIARDAHEQALAGKKVTLEEALPGDLLFFAYEEGKGFIHHVGVYLGSDLMIHSQTPGSKVLITHIIDTNYQKELCMIRRYWE
ncbi:C40 family peptidase [Enterococcus italicus]|uniref:C40 family peptidase n=1 Tax=Enterococcus italicus TaxID=246144 RepID=UPI0028A72CC2|nr:C40 family peptidase [Enterococcus italicus]